MEPFRYSDDVRDVVTLANKHVRKTNRQAVGDRDYLQALLLSRRQFSRLDSLLKDMGVPAGRMKAQLASAEAVSAPGATTDLLKNAEIIAQAARPGNGKSDTTEVEMEDLLKALCLSADSVVSRLFAENRITPERIDAAVIQSRRKQPQRTFMFLLKELAEVVIFVLVFLILIKSFLGELRLIPSESMVPILQVNDRLVIERVSRWVRPYQRGDILVFYPPMTELHKDPLSVFLRLTGFSGLMYKKEDNIDVAYIKRLIGLPGDTVDVKPGLGVFVNGKKLDEPYINEIAETCTVMRPVPTQGLFPTCSAIKVPPNHYYMMGDNRNLSLDSRYWGFAEQDRVIGRAVYRIWPLNRLGTMDSPLYQNNQVGP